MTDRVLLKYLKNSLKEFKDEQYALRIHWLGKFKVKKYLLNLPLKLHLGCGSNYKPNWLNIDFSNSKADLHLDLRRELPFPDNSCDEIYSEHLLEHLDYPHDALFFLEELNRIIKPNKKVTTIVPDTVWPMQSYFDGENAEYFTLAKNKDFGQNEIFTTRIEQINYHFRQKGEHKFAYDEETLMKILKKAGFDKNIIRDFDPKTDSAFRNPGSIYIESYKTR